jgi:predicted transcriptional regulator YdeE
MFLSQSTLDIAAFTPDLFSTMIVGLYGEKYMNVMEIYNLAHDITVFGLQVKAFPSGIGEAFDELIKKTGDCADARAYYGISEFKDGKMLYYAVAEEKIKGEAEKYDYEKLKIEEGNYLTSTVFDWRKKTECIKDVFYEIIQDPRVNKTKPAIEWYKSDNEMMCMVKMND